jgi:hypothetical protein
MPISAYFQGKGKQVMGDMQDRYGDDKGKREFYATANKQNQKPKRKRGFVARAIEQQRA